MHCLINDINIPLSQPSVRHQTFANNGWIWGNGLLQERGVAPPPPLSLTIPCLWHPPYRWRPPLSMSLFLSYTHILRFASKTRLDDFLKPHIDDAFALSTTMGVYNGRLWPFLPRCVPKNSSGIYMLHKFLILYLITSHYAIQKKITGLHRI